MNKKDVICFEMLGSFSNMQKIPGKVGKKTLSFLQYLLVNHSRSISTEELIDEFWTKSKSNDPANALRNMLFKIRSLLKEMFPGQGSLLQTLQGCYIWNPDVDIELDTECFERYCLEAKKSSGYERQELLRKAVLIYKGDFLSGNDSEWVRVPRQYYRTLYLDACRVLLPMLEKREQWTEIVGVCNRACQVDSFREDFAAYQMQAFIAIGQPEQAVKKYELFKEQMMNEMGVVPSEHVEQMHILALGLCKKSERNDQEIFQLVCEEQFEHCAFFCSFGMFRSIVALERQHLAISGQSATLVIITLGGDTALETDARRLEHILQEELQVVNPVARLEADAYILMLTGMDKEGAQSVLSRLDCAFHRTYRHSNAQLSFRLSALYPREGKRMAV